MCYCLFLGTDFPQSTAEFVSESTTFFLSEASEDELDNGLRAKFSKKHIYRVGSWQGCGCGFDFPIDDSVGDPNSRKSAELLISTIQTLAVHEVVELYCCWEGCWGIEAEHFFIKSAMEIGGTDFLEEQVFWKIH